MTALLKGIQSDVVHAVSTACSSAVYALQPQGGDAKFAGVDAESHTAGLISHICLTLIVSSSAWANDAFFASSIVAAGHTGSVTDSNAGKAFSVTKLWGLTHTSAEAHRNQIQSGNAFQPRLGVCSDRLCPPSRFVSINHHVLDCL